MAAPKDVIPHQQQEEIFERLMSRPENKHCADCNSKGPRWVSMDFGVFICLNCAGHHRNLGPSITRVRSVKLDSWKMEWINIMENTGNEKANDFYEFSLPPGRKPDSSWDTNEIRRFIGDKYVKKVWASHDLRDPVAVFLSKPESFKAAPPSKQVETKPPIQKQPAAGTVTKPNNVKALQSTNVQKPTAPAIWDGFNFGSSPAPTKDVAAAPQQQQPPKPKISEQMNLLDMDFDVTQFNSATAAQKPASLFDTPDTNASDKVLGAQNAFKQFHSTCAPSSHIKKDPFEANHLPLLAPKTSWPDQTVKQQQHHAHTPHPQNPFNLMDLYDQKSTTQSKTTTNETSKLNEFQTFSGAMEPAKAAPIPRGNYDFLNHMGRQPIHAQFGTFQNQGPVQTNAFAGFSTNQPVKAQHFSAGFNFPVQETAGGVVTQQMPIGTQGNSNFQWNF